MGKLTIDPAVAAAMQTGNIQGLQSNVFDCLNTLSAGEKLCSLVVPNLSRSHDIGDEAVLWYSFSHLHSSGPALSLKFRSNIRFFSEASASYDAYVEAINIDPSAQAQIRSVRISSGNRDAVFDGGDARFETRELRWSPEDNQWYLFLDGKKSRQASSIEQQVIMQAKRVWESALLATGLAKRS